MWHIDATGSIIKRTGKQVLLYSLVEDSNIKGEPCIPVFEFLSENHDSNSIINALMTFKILVKELTSFPDFFVTDMSWALMHSICECFMGTSLQEQIKIQWEMFSNDTRNDKSNLLLCGSHFLNNIRKKMAKNIPNKQVCSLEFK